jgi:AcrR family transcriptional regulator
MSIPRRREAYHHGDLRRELLREGLALVRELGIEGLTLQKLAKRVGVSAPALYHHFASKQALLFALGEAAIGELETALAPTLTPTRTSSGAEVGVPLEAFVLTYVRFARENPELYELMFGRSTWRGGERTEFHAHARRSFRALGERVALLRLAGHVPSRVEPLRLTQVAWATLHGLCCMYNDGLAFTAETVEDIAKYAVKLLTSALHED